MNNRVAIIDPGIIPLKEILASIENMNLNICFIQRKELINRIRGSWPEINQYNFFCYTDFGLVKANIQSDLLKTLYNRLYDSIVSDYRTFLISERINYRVCPWQNNFSDLQLIDTLISNYIQLLEKEQPSYIFFQATPHDIYSWVLGKVAELMRIPVYLARSSILPWKSVLVRGLDEQTLVDADFEDNVRENYSLVEKFYNIHLGKYDEAIPSYEKKRLDARKGKFWSWKTELKEPMRRPHRIVAVLRKHYLFKYYQSLATSEITNQDYIIVFLHFQPERTSLPEGQQFAQQFHLIRTLQIANPGIKIYVKEHPSMFIGHLDIRYRTKSFYKAISDLDNVELVDIRTDAFSLIDKALSLATITGTVGVQALIRGKGVLCFGTSSYLGLDGVFQIKNCEDAQKAISELLRNKRKEGLDISKSTLANMHRIDRIAANGIESNTTDISDFYNQEYRLRSDAIVLKWLLHNA